MARTFSAKKLLTHLVAPLFYILLIVFLIVYIQHTDFSRLQGMEIAWPYVLLATVLALAFRYWGALIWLVLLQGLGATGLRKQFSVLAYVYAKSWLGRYIPGTAPWILGKIYFASQQGISKNKLAVSSLLEGALQIVVVMALAFVLLMLDPRLDVVEAHYKFIMLGVIVLCIIAMIPAVFNRFVAFAYKLIRKKNLAREDMADGKTILKGASLYAVGALMSGLSFFFIAKAIYPELAYADIFFVMGVTNLAAAASMLAIFAPSGLGVREGLQLVLLSLIMPGGFALLITVVMRVWSIAVDFLFFIMAWTIKRWRRK